MTFEEYQKGAMSTEAMGRPGSITDLSFVAKVLGLVGESGEFADKIKKIYRDNGGQITEDQNRELLKELGDVLWYVSVLADFLGSDVQEVAEMNLAKLADRKKRDQIKGSGDNR